MKNRNAFLGGEKRTLGLAQNVRLGCQVYPLIGPPTFVV